MERVLGIGGIFFIAEDKAALLDWYRNNLGIDVEDWGGARFSWKEHDHDGHAATVWSPFSKESKYFAPSTKPFMLNFRVRDLDAMLAQLRERGCNVDDRLDESEFGRFGWVMDPEGNRIELWEPPAR